MDFGTHKGSWTQWPRVAWRTMLIQQSVSQKAGNAPAGSCVRGILLQGPDSVLALTHGLSQKTATILAL